MVFIWPIFFHAKPCLCCSLNRKNNPIDITGTCFTMTTSNCNAKIYLHDYNPLFFDNESNFWCCRKCCDRIWYPKKEKQNGIKTFAKTCLFSINRKNNPIKITGTCFKMTSSTCNAKTYLYYCNILFLDKESNFWWYRQCWDHYSKDTVQATSTFVTHRVAEAEAGSWVGKKFTASRHL